MCKAVLLNRSGLVLERLAANVLLHAQVEPNHLATAMVNATTDQRATEHARVTRITLVLRAARNAIATPGNVPMAHLVMEIARASRGPMVLSAAKHAIATPENVPMAHLVMEFARASRARMDLPAVAPVIATSREEFATILH